MNKIKFWLSINTFAMNWYFITVQLYFLNKYLTFIFFNVIINNIKIIEKYFLNKYLTFIFL